VIGIDTARRRVSLSLKQLSNAPSGHRSGPVTYRYDEDEE
jgi:ribosomal protein S1